MTLTVVPDEAVGTSFRAMMRKFPATVTIVTGRNDGVDHGMTVTAVTSVSMEPPSLVVCLNNRTYLHEMLLCHPNFAVNVLTQKQRPLSEAFSGKVAPEHRFRPDEWERHSSGVLMLAGAHARVVCRRVAAVPYGTHTLFLGQAIDAFVDDVTRPLLYEDARYCISQPAA
jgi:flavin reductase (DIM6/NTAB) family NADH-FMN oxidoreductase RutF